MADLMQDQAQQQRRREENQIDQRPQGIALEAGKQLRILENNIF